MLGVKRCAAESGSWITNFSGARRFEVAAAFRPRCARAVAGLADLERQRKLGSVSPAPRASDAGLNGRRPRGGLRCVDRAPWRATLRHQASGDRSWFGGSSVSRPIEGLDSHGAVASLRRTRTPTSSGRFASAKTSASAKRLSRVKIRFAASGWRRGCRRQDARQHPPAQQRGQKAVSRPRPAPQPMLHAAPPASRCDWPAAAPAAH